jgi:hypothetical protein
MLKRRDLSEAVRRIGPVLSFNPRRMQHESHRKESSQISKTGLKKGQIDCPESTFGRLRVGLHRPDGGVEERAVCAS